MSTTSASGGNLVIPPLNPTADLAKEVGANFVQIPAGAGVAQAITPVAPQQSVTVINLTANWIRATITLSAGIVAVGAAATRVALVPPGFNATVDLGNVDYEYTAGSVNPIASVSVIAVATPTATAEASTLAAATAAVAGSVVLQFASA